MCRVVHGIQRQRVPCCLVFGGSVDCAVWFSADLWTVLFGFRPAGGVFVVLLCGLALAMIVAVLEFCWNSKKNAQTDRVSAVA